METDNKLSSLFVDLCNFLSEENVQALDFSLRLHPDHRWPTLEPVTARAVLLKMKELGMWRVDPKHRVVYLSFLIGRLEIIGRRDLSAKVKEFG